MEIYVMLSVPFGWMFLSKLQKGFIFFTTLQNYFVVKAILSVLIGWAVTPFYLVYYGFKITRGFIKLFMAKDKSNASG